MIIVIQYSGDCYMVCSGLPNRNGIKHAAETARISLAFLECCKEIKVFHLPEQHVKMRFGINSGPVTAGERS